MAANRRLHPAYQGEAPRTADPRARSTLSVRAIAPDPYHRGTMRSVFPRLMLMSLVLLPLGGSLAAQDPGDGKASVEARFVPATARAGEVVTLVTKVVAGL